jgi:GTP-binding protein
LSERADYIRTVVLLIDTKIGLQEKDMEMFHYVQKLNLPVIIVLSKIDRLSKSEVIKAKLHTEKELFGQKVMPISSHKKT